MHLLEQNWGRWFRLPTHRPIFFPVVLASCVSLGSVASRHSSSPIRGAAEAVVLTRAWADGLVGVWPPEPAAWSGPSPSDSLCCLGQPSHTEGLGLSLPSGGRSCRSGINLQNELNYFPVS